MSHFFAYMSRMKFIRRWGLMHNTYPENVQEHSARAAMIAHSLALIRNRLYGGDVNPERAACLALYHDASEVLTGDLPTPVKYFNPDIRTAYQGIERVARQKLLDMMPEPLAEAYRPYLFPADADAAHWELVKAADRLAAYTKCLEELAAGNREFTKAEKALRSGVDALDLPEVRYFLETFGPSLRLTLDELG
jgi:5'-deoxynucleotidase